MTNGTVYDKLRWFKKLLEKEGLLFEKYRQIHYIVEKELETALFEKKQIHDIDLLSWALWASQVDKELTIKASIIWIQKFKTMNQVVSCMITSINLKNKLTLCRQCADYIVNVKSLSKEFSPACIHNSGQSFFNYKMHSGRTLTFKATKDITVLIFNPKMSRLIPTLFSLQFHWIACIIFVLSVFRKKGVSY